MIDEWQTTFSGGVFNDTIDGGRAGADIELSTDGISARTSTGSRFLVRYLDCQLEVGGFSGRMVFCRTPDRSLTIFCEDRQFPAALSHASSGLLDDQLGSSLKQRRALTRRGWWIGALVLVVAVILFAGGYFAIREGARAAVQAVPVSVDREIGSQAFKAMDLGGPELADPVVVAALQSLVDQLAPYAAIEGLQFEVHVVEAANVNAFALPGGTIVVYTGLITAADEPEQVAGVLAHEMAHATLRHGIERIGHSLGIATAVNLLLGDMQGLVVAGAEMFQLATINSYSRDQETAADIEGVRMLHAAGINPLGLAKFFDTLKDQQSDMPAGLAWISTHPQHDVRIAGVRDLVAELPKQEYRPLDVDWAEVQRRVKHE